MCFVFFASTSLSQQAVGQGSVMIAATEGGSVELTPTGIVRHEPNMMLLKGVSNAPKAEKAPVVEEKVIKVKLDILDIEEAKLIRNSLAYVIYQDVPDSVDYKALTRTIKYISDYDNLSERDKSFNIIVTAKSIQTLMGNSMYDVDMYKQQLERAKVQEKIAKKAFKEVRKEETAMAIPEEKKISKRFEYQFKEEIEAEKLETEKAEAEKEAKLKGIFKKKK